LQQEAEEARIKYEELKQLLQKAEAHLNKFSEVNKTQLSSPMFGPASPAPVQEVTSDEVGLPANDEEAENNNKNSHPSTLPSSTIIDGTNTISIGDHMRWLEENDINAFYLLKTTLTTRNMAASKVTTPECNTISPYH
jgi:hypothetical protein